MVAAVKKGRHAALASSGADPFSRIKLSQCLPDSVLVIGRLADGQKRPVGLVRAREKPVDQEDLIGLEKGRQLRLKIAADPIPGSIENHRGVFGAMGEIEALGEGPCGRARMVHRLEDVDLERLGETLERLDLGDLEAGQTLQFLKERFLLRFVRFRVTANKDQSEQDKSGQSLGELAGHMFGTVLSH
jgi:hypothetical protein